MAKIEVRRNDGDLPTNVALLRNGFECWQRIAFENRNIFEKLFDFRRRIAFASKKSLKIAFVSPSRIPVVDDGENRTKATMDGKTTGICRRQGFAALVRNGAECRRRIAFENRNIFEKLFDFRRRIAFVSKKNLKIAFVLPSICEGDDGDSPTTVALVRNGGESPPKIEKFRLREYALVCCVFFFVRKITVFSLDALVRLISHALFFP